MTLEQRLNSLDQLGELLRNYTGNKLPFNTETGHLENAVQEAFRANPWFTPEHIRFALSHWGNLLHKKNLESWINAYLLLDEESLYSKRVGLVMAGNIPLVGFHDLLCVMISGHKAVIKLSSQDNLLIPALTDCLRRINPEWSEKIEISDTELDHPEMVIATGSNNSARYFSHYFGKYPHIIRKNRTGVAVLTGHENTEELKELASDLFLYFGLGCRNVSKVFIPASFDTERLLLSFSSFSHFLEHTRYRHNLDFYKAVFLVNNIKFCDGGFFLLKEDPEWVSPVSVVYYERYNELNAVRDRISENRDQIQCVVTTITDWPDRILPGYTQRPTLTDYADQVDTLAFLLEKKQV